MMQQIQEGDARCTVPLAKKISAKMEVFYNPAMKENRDITILFLNAFFVRQFSAASIMAGTGVREVRLLKEVPLLKFIAINDGNPNATKLIKKNLDANTIPQNNYLLTTVEASLFLLSGHAWDYIDIDPFGTPNSFLDAAIKKCKHAGILGVTATDTAALAGTYPKATLRKYWATPLRAHIMHEVGLRILLRKIQLIAAQYDKAAIPVFSYSAQHYYRVFVQLLDSKSGTEAIVRQHGHIIYCRSCCMASLEPSCSCTLLMQAGPLWLGHLWNKEIAEQMAKNNVWKERKHLLGTIMDEAGISIVGFFDMHAYAESRHSSFIPRITDSVQLLKEKGFHAARTHLSPYGVRTTAPVSEIEKLFIRQHA